MTGIWLIVLAAVSLLFGGLMAARSNKEKSMSDDSDGMVAVVFINDFEPDEYPHDYKWNFGPLLVEIYKPNTSNISNNSNNIAPGDLVASYQASQVLSVCRIDGEEE